MFSPLVNNKILALPVEEPGVNQPSHKFAGISMVVAGIRYRFRLIGREPLATSDLASQP